MWPLQQALAEASAAAAGGASRDDSMQRQEEGEEEALPPPMIPDTPEAPTSFCAIQEAFQGVAAGSRGFEWRPERPGGASFAEQKWAWTGTQPGGLRWGIAALPPAGSMTAPSLARPTRLVIFSCCFPPRRQLAGIAG